MLPCILIVLLKKKNTVILQTISIRKWSNEKMKKLKYSEPVEARAVLIP